MENKPNKYKIFIADHDKVVLRYLRQMLSKEYDVVTANNFDNALIVIKKIVPDIILLDVFMPGINGFDFCKILKKDKETKNISVIFMSSQGDSENIIRGLEAGGVDFISKPINKAEILTRINTHLAMLKVQKKMALSNKNLNNALKETTKALDEEIINNERINAILVESESRYQNVFQGVPEAIIIVNVDSGEIVDVNNSGCELFGYSYEELIGMNQIELLQSSEETIQENIFRTQSEEFKYSNVRMSFNTLIKKNGEKIPVKNSSKTILIEGELYIFALIFNLSEWIKIGNELKQARIHAEELNRLKGFFLANMSHELRTPLISILGFSTILDEELEDITLKNMAHSISVSGNRLLNTLKVLFDYSTFENGSQKVDWGDINLSKIIYDVAFDYKDASDKKALIVNLDCKKDVVIHADYNFIKEVFSQLLNNAINYTQKGTINLKLETETIDNKLYALFSIQDTGIGIKENKLNSIFEDFRQGSEGYSRDFDGLGLGLALVKKIVELHNGEITVESKENVGSLFKVKLEIEREP